MKELNILFLEDDKIEVLKFERVLTSLDPDHTLEVVNNGEEALEFLKKNSIPPDIILLDLNMPKLNGIEFLRLIKSDPRLMYIPAVVLTTSLNNKDLFECYKLGIAGYILKPLKYEDYLIKIKYMIDYWSINEFKK